MADRPLPPWPTIARGPRQDYRVFAVEQVERRSPRTGAVRAFQVLHMPDWVNVVAVTGDREVVLVEQFRQGIEELTIEIPGGMVDPDEDAADAAARELLEETGYAGDVPRLLGRVHPNPAIQTNRCSTWLIENACQVSDPSPDEGEHLRVLTAPDAALVEWIRDGRISHALVVAAIAHWQWSMVDRNGEGRHDAGASMRRL